MASKQITKAQFARLRVGQRLRFYTFGGPGENTVTLEGTLQTAFRPPEHPRGAPPGAFRDIVLGVQDDAGNPYSLFSFQVLEVLSEPDPELEARYKSWLASRRLPALRARRRSLCDELAAAWIGAGGHQSEESIAAVPYSGGEGSRFKLIGNRGRIVGTYRTPNGPLLMRDEELRGRAMQALAEHNIALPKVDLERPYARGIGVKHMHDWWAVHPVGEGELGSGALLASFHPGDGDLKTRLPELAEFFVALIGRHGHVVQNCGIQELQVAYTDPESLPPLTWRTQRELDSDISLLCSMLGREAEPDTCPLTFDARPDRDRDAPPGREPNLGTVGKLPPSVIEVLRQHLKTPRNLWDLADDGTPISSLVGERYMYGAWSPRVQGIIRSAPVRVDLPDGAPQTFSRWKSISPIHAPKAAAQELLMTHTSWRDDLLAEPATLAMHRGWLGAIEPALNDLPFPERVHGPSGTGIKAAVEDLVAAQLLSRLGEEIEDVPQPTLHCEVCSFEFKVRALSSGEVHQVGSVRFCPVCINDSWNGLLHDDGIDHPWFDVGLWAHRAAADEFGGPPSRLQVEAKLESSPDPALQVVVRMLLPRPVKSAFSADRKPLSWTEWLAEAGVLGQGGLSVSRGTSVTASDGHMCRSLLERHVDDFMFRHDIRHEPEPHYPWHPELNPTGMRADWRLPDGTLVEALGLAGDRGYDLKTQRKMELAQLLSAPLLLIQPTDLGRLPELFAKWL
jgi:hypothetical protein